MEYLLQMKPGMWGSDVTSYREYHSNDEHCSYSLSPSYYNDVKKDWPFYAEDTCTRREVKRKLNHIKVTLLKKLAFEDFEQGLRSYINRCWSVISREDTRAVLGWCITDAASTKCTRVLLEAAIECTPAYVESRAVFLFSNFFLERAARMPSFKVTSRLSPSESSL